MLKNEKRPGYKKTKVGWIPDDWKCVPFATVFDLTMVSLAPTPSVKYREIGVRSHGKGIFHKPPVTGESLGDKRVFHCQPGTLVFNIVFAWEQAVAVLSESERGFIASHRFPMFQGRKNQASEAYYLLFFKTRRGKEQLTIASPGGAGRNKTLGQSDLEVLPVPCPPFPEQIAIAEVLECWDKVIRTLEVKIGKRRLVKQGLMQKLLSGRIRLPG
ncbi:MAG: restriction endonuclease subunit S, partial [Terrimicrobiaceae bacterium]